MKCFEVPSALRAKSWRGGRGGHSTHEARRAGVGHQGPRTKMARSQTKGAGTMGGGEGYLERRGREDEASRARSWRGDAERGAGRQAHREAESGEEGDHKEIRERLYLHEICTKNLVYILLHMIDGPS